MTFTFLAFYIGCALLILFGGGRLVRTDLDRARAESEGAFYPRSRLLKDLRPVEDTMMEFIAESPRCREVMRWLANSHHPIALLRLFGSTPAFETNWSALFVMTVAGLLGFGRGGITLTSVGREVLARINRATTDVSQIELKAAESKIRRLEVPAASDKSQAALAKVT